MFLDSYEGITIQDTFVSSVIVEVKAQQHEDPIVEQLKGKDQHQKSLAINRVEDRILRYGHRWCVPNVPSLRHQIIIEAHYSRYLIHHDSTKIYHDIKDTRGLG
ncbi:hypothetical protein MTR67_052205 [Solanum verrucosum]|uniref:Uncharacterized protein n=1 Tax=Solanum verrucosum TaxID=315347 RepID=A0AAF1A330_SOLVR|nr:hypothetical protein MTR67_052205 [Solanum verrucosum]